MLTTIFRETFDTGDVSNYEADYQLLMKVQCSLPATAAVACQATIRCPVTFSNRMVLYFLGFYFEPTL